MNDPITVALGPWGQLGLAGSLVIILALVCWKLFNYLAEAKEKHLADVKGFADKLSDIIVDNAKSQTALASAIDRIGDRVK